MEGSNKCICTVIATTVSWDCVESRHKIVDDFFVSAAFSFKSESMDVAEACHAAAWKGNMWRITLTDAAIVSWTILQTAFIERRANCCNRHGSGAVSSFVFLRDVFNRRGD